MRTAIFSRPVLVLLVLCCLAFTDPFTIKRISDANFKYEFYTSYKKITPSGGKTYYWFKGGAIHSSESGIGGELLNDKFAKFYHGNQLAEAGQFEDGLKTGIWKTWYPTGILKTTEVWKSGYKKGNYFFYDDNGILHQSGNYSVNKKHGIWIDHLEKDTVVYKNGTVFVKKAKLSKEDAKALKPAKKPGFLKRIFTCEKADSTVNTAAPAAKKPRFFKRLFGKKEAPANQPAATDPSQPARKSFFGRLFGKKEPKQKSNG